ncbi:transposase [Cupriavidus basilensis]|uniref:Transposase n=1 Tax=Cupriavidus basilensis TaxID=68895 RepID=A0ABT6B4Q6_9BURK|nr:transposase [Cupriavidus basilensis]MDF3839865.1 transposase [Cupriavidus basilensis]
MNKAILDRWYEFRLQLDYKLTWNGGWLVAVLQQSTNRTCPCCGRVAAENRPNLATFECVVCGFEEHTDVVGSINVLRAGQAQIACEVGGAIMPPTAGTRRSDSEDGSMPYLSAVRILALSAQRAAADG